MPKAFKNEIVSCNPLPLYIQSGPKVGIQRMLYITLFIVHLLLAHCVYTCAISWSKSYLCIVTEFTCEIKVISSLSKSLRHNGREGGVQV